MTARLSCSLLLLLAAASVRASEDAGTESPLMLGSGARALAMGRSATAIADDADALFWNPARLSVLRQAEFDLFQTKLYEDGVSMQAASIAYPTLDLGSFALGVQTLGVGDIERRDDRNALLGSFDDRETHMLLGYGRSVHPALSIGGTLRIAQQRVADLSATGFGVDFGLASERQLGRPEHRLYGGLMVQNLIEPSLRLDEEDVADPRRVRAGVGYGGRATSTELSWTVAADLEWPRAADPRVGAGLELRYAELLSLRAGLEEGDPTFGFGIAYGGLHVAYALRTHDELSRNDRFSVAWRFGLGVQERRDERRRAQETRVESLLADRLADREKAALAAALGAAGRAETAEEFEEARRLYRRVLALSPDHEGATEGLDRVELHLARQAADAALAAGEFAQASALYQAVLGRWPEDRAASRGLERARAALRAAEDRVEQLASLFRTALDRYTDGDLDGAEADLRELLTLAPEHELGEELLARIVTARAERADAEVARARRLWDEGRGERALRALAAASRLQPGRSDVARLDEEWRAELAARAAAAQRQARLAEDSARARTEEPTASRRPAPRRSPDAAERARLDALFREGLDLFSAGDFDGAIRRWQSIWAAWPDYENVAEYLVKAHLFEGIELYSQGDYDAALERCRRVLAIDPDHGKALRYVERIEEERAELDASARRSR